MLVLVFDSSEPSRSVLELQLRQLGVLAMGASQLQEALQILRASAVDVLLLACKGSVDEALHDWQALREAAGRQPRFIGITPDPHSDNLVQLRAAGFTEFLAADLDPERLRQTLDGPAPETAEDSIERSLMDHTRLQDLLDIAELSGAEAVAEILATFFNSSEERLEQMRQALQTKDEATLRRIRHGWAGISGSLGARRLTMSLKSLDPVEMLQSSAHGQQVLTRLEAEFEDSRAFLDVFIQGLSRP